jgi:hypothetical protein
MGYNVDACLVCGKQIRKDNENATSDMVKVNIDLEYMCSRDAEHKERPTLVIINGERCPDCLMAEITEFINVCKGIPKTKIGEDRIITPGTNVKLRRVRSDKGPKVPAVDPRQANMEQFIK